MKINIKMKVGAFSVVAILLMASAAAMVTTDSSESPQLLGAEETIDHDLATALIAEAINNTAERTGLTAVDVDGVLTIYSDGEIILILDPVRGLIAPDEMMPLWEMWIFQRFTVNVFQVAKPAWVFPKLTVVIAAAFIIGWFIGANMPSESGDTEAINLAFRHYESEIIFRTTVTATELLGQLLQMDSSLLRLTELYFNRMMEVTAASFWSPGGTQYDPEALIRFSGVLDYITNYTYNYQVCIEQPFWQFKDIRSSWYTQPAYDSMIISFVSNSANNNILPPTVKGNFTTSANSEIFIDACQIVTPTPTANRVFFDAQLGEEYTKASHTIYVLGIPSGATVTKTDDNGFTYRLSAGANNVLTTWDVTGTHLLQSGWFTLQSGAIYCGSYYSSMDQFAAPVIGGLMLFDSGNFAFAFYNGINYTIVGQSGSVSTISEVTLRISYTGDDQRGEPARTQLNAILEGYRALIDAQTSIGINATDAGRTVWNLYTFLDVNGALTADEFITLGILSPSAIAFSPSADLSQEGLMMVQFAAMRQIANLMGNVDLTALTFSDASLISYFYGSVTYEGRVIAENAVFSLISYMPHDIRVESGQRLHWPGQGLLIVWSNYLESLDDWDGIMSADEVKLIDLTGQFSVDIAYIFVDGDEVDHLILIADTMERMGLLNLSDYRPHGVPQPQSVGEVVLHVILAIIIMIVLLWVCTKLGYVGAVIALVVLVIGGLYIATVTGFISGLFDRLLPSWWPR